MSSDPLLNILLRLGVRLLFRKDNILIHSHPVLMPSDPRQQDGVRFGFIVGCSHGFLANLITALLFGTNTVILEDLSMSLLPKLIPLA